MSAVAAKALKKEANKTAILEANVTKAETELTEAEEKERRDEIKVIAATCQPSLTEPNPTPVAQ